MPKAFLFDVGNVIIGFDFSITARKLARQCEVSPEDALKLVAPLTDQLESGHMSADEFLEEAGNRIQYRGTRSEMRAAFEDIFTLNLPMVEFINSLHGKGIPLHLLSNTNAIHAPFFEKTYPVFGCFSGRIYSYEVGCMKPSPEIFRITIDKLSINPAETIYIDDSPANCEAGREAGFNALCYNKEEHDAFLAVVGALVEE